MAGRGPAGKPPSERVRRNRVEPETVVSGDGVLRGPELPGSMEWPAATLEWWSTWRRSAQAVTFTETDWSFLIDTAVLHAAYWLGNASVAGELRLRVAKFGATPEDRLRLKLSVGEPSPSPVPQSGQSKGRKDRILKAVEDA